MSLRRKLILTHTAVALIVIVLIVVSVSVVIGRAFEQLAREQSQATGRSLAVPLAQCYERLGNWDAVTRECLQPPSQRRREAIRLPPDQRLLIVDSANQIRFDSGRQQRVGQLLKPKEQAYSVPVSIAGQQIGAVVVIPAQGVFGQAEDRFLQVVRRAIIIMGVAAIIIALVIGAALAQGMTSPLRVLTEAVQRLASGTRQVQVTNSSRDEVGDLSRAFNQMSSELNRQETLRRQMVADIAHELRTPLSVLKLELESIEDGVTQPTPAAMSSLGEEVTLLSRLIDDLRLLSLTEAGQLNLNLEPLDVHALVERVTERMRSAAIEGQITLHAYAADHLPGAFGDSARLQQVLGNLLSNALRYTPPSGSVDVAAEQHGNEIIISVRDTGPGFSADEAASIFERFYRTDRARARDTGGSGLGLAIVRGLVQAMGGRVWAESQPGRGATFFVALPIVGRREARG